jgi:biopolymer transport protein ExbD
MNFRREPEEEVAFPLTPLIDIAFLLLFFFMTLSTLFQLEKEMKVNVPAAENAAQPTSSIRQLVINLKIHRDDQGKIIDNKSEIWVNQSLLTPRQLSDKLNLLATMTGPRRVLIRADGDTLYKDVMEIMDICRGAKIEDYVLAAVEKAAE